MLNVLVDPEEIELCEKVYSVKHHFNMKLLDDLLGIRSFRLIIGQFNALLEAGDDQILIAMTNSDPNFQKGISYLMEVVAEVDELEEGIM